MVYILTIVIGLAVFRLFLDLNSDILHPHIFLRATADDQLVKARASRIIT
jgi:hypothetical protein